MVPGRWGLVQSCNHAQPHEWRWETGCASGAGPRVRSVMGGTQAGYVLITPLVSARWGKGVLVNRGWVPAEWRSDPALRAGGQPIGQVPIAPTDHALVLCYPRRTCRRACVRLVLYSLNIGGTVGFCRAGHSQRG